MAFRYCDTCGAPQDAPTFEQAVANDYRCVNEHPMTMYDEERTAAIMSAYEGLVERLERIEALLAL